MTRGGLLLRLALAAVLGICLWKAALAKADPSVEHLMVPLTAMGRDIPVAFLAGGPVRGACRMRSTPARMSAGV
jgi:hypothetical protein